MGTNLRRLGVYGDNLPTRKNKVVAASDFLIGGIIGKFERVYRKAFAVHNPAEFQEIFGDNISALNYGWDVVQGFFANVAGVDATLYVASFSGYTGSAYDSVAATASPLDGSSATTIRIDSAYQTDLDYGTSGNRTGYKITNGYRFTTQCSASTTKDDTFVYLDSVAGIRVGDIMKFVASGDGSATVYKKITSVDFSLSKVSFSGAFHASYYFKLDDYAYVIGFKLQTYRKALNGTVSEVDVELGKVWCTMEPEVTDYYVQNVFASSKWIKVTDLASVSVLQLSFPVDVATVTYLASGADGTAPTSVSTYAPSLTYFDSLPVRMIANCETTNVDVQKAIETYCQARWDNPKVIYNIAENQTKAQLITIGNNYQRSDDVLGVIVANWVGVPDSFSTSDLASYRHIPNVGHVMGCWIRSIGTNGIHFIPATSATPLYSVSSVIGDTFPSDIDRTELAEAGINVIQARSGFGYVIRNFFTPSITTEFMFANGIMFRDFIKVSAVDSLQDSENYPNTYDRIKADRMAILQFFYQLWERGSTGSVMTGETFGQSIDANGAPTKPTDHFEVQADLINNPQSKINLGERNLDCWVTYPSPAGSIKIGVGLWLRS